MGKNQSASNLTNIIKQDGSGNIVFTSGSTTLATISTSGQLSGSTPALSASYAATSSYATNFNVSGTITATTLVVQTITSSVDFVTGSTRFGSTLANTHVFTGSASITGSLAVVTNGTEFQVGATGVNLGNALTDSHIISGSLTVNPGGLFVSSSNKVGIGTTNPDNSYQGLTIFGSDPSLRLKTNSSGGWTWIEYVNNSNTNNFSMGVNQSAPFFGIKAGAGMDNPNFVVSSAGNIGIGTTSPGYKLHIVAGGDHIRLSRTSFTDWQFGVGTANAINGLHIGAGSSTYVSVDQSNGAVSVPRIFTSYSGVKVSGYGALSQTLSGEMTILGHNIIADTSTGNTVTVMNSGWYSSMIKMYYNEGITFHTSLTVYNAGDVYPMTGTERMRITSGGIFVTYDGQDQLVIRNASDNNRQLLVGYVYSGNYGRIQAIQQGQAYRSLYLNQDGGAVFAGSVRLDTLSDARIKDNIQEIDGALNKVLSITGKKFHLKDEEEGKLRYGFIAQELEGVLDEFVIQTNMTFKQDDLEVKNVKSIDNWASSWAALLVEAIKELNTKLDAANAEIEALKNK